MFTLPKKNILRHKKEIENLLQSQNKIRGNFILLQYNNVDHIENKNRIQFLFIVGKKRFKKAVDRNRIKRLLREAVRLNKDILDNEKNLCLHIQLSYQEKEIKTFIDIENDVQSIFKKLKEKL